MTETVKTWNFRAPGVKDFSKSVDVVRIDRGLYDLFDNGTGECLNEGCPFPFIPTKKELREFLNTGKIKGTIE